MAAKVQYGNCKWHCAICNRWNDITHISCPGCGVPQQGASAYKTENVLTPEERNAYTGTLPAILSEVRAIRTLLERKNKEG
jgi:hypothetical protein